VSTIICSSACDFYITGICAIGQHHYFACNSVQITLRFLSDVAELFAIGTHFSVVMCAHACVNCSQFMCLICTAVYVYYIHEQLHRAFREHLSTYVDTSTYGEAFKKRKRELPPTAASTTASPADTTAAATGATTVASSAAAAAAAVSADSTNGVATDAISSTDGTTDGVIEPDASQIVIIVTPLRQRKRAQQTSNSLSKYGPASSQQQQQQASIYRNNRKEPWPIDRPEYCKFAIHKVCVRYVTHTTYAGVLYYTCLYRHAQ
jgi:hypothetical protein